MSNVLVVVGSANVDLVVRTAELPRAGETVLGRRVERFGGGKGANADVAAAWLGAAVAFVGAVGDDDFGEWVPLLAALALVVHCRRGSTSSPPECVRLRGARLSLPKHRAADRHTEMEV
jgi:fructose-1-phosphate kinase PfkB-like protein